MNNIYIYFDPTTEMHVLKDVKDGIAFVKLNRPEKRNALTSEMLRALYEIFEEGEKDVVVLSGEGRDFCAGHDFREVLENPEEHFKLCRKVMKAIRDSEKVVISCVRGYAVAGGCQLVAVSDLAIASENAKFGLTGIRFGLFCYTPLVFVSRCVGVKRAFELAFTGEVIDAKKAYDWGLVNRVVEDGRLEEECLKLAKKISERSEVLGNAKRFFYGQIDVDVFKAFDWGITEIIKNIPIAEKEIRRFLEK